MAFPPKKKKGDFALLMAEPKKPTPGQEPDESEFDDASDLGDEEDPLMDDGGSDDPMGDATDPGIDPEQAALAQTLGFTDPDQQQALIDLIKLVTSQDPMTSSDSGSTLPPLPESTY